MWFTRNISAVVGALNLTPDELANNVCVCVKDCDSSPVVDYISVFQAINNYKPIDLLTQGPAKKEDQEEEIEEVDPPTPITPAKTSPKDKEKKHPKTKEDKKAKSKSKGSKKRIVGEQRV